MRADPSRRASGQPARAPARSTSHPQRILPAAGAGEEMSIRAIDPFFFFTMRRAPALARRGIAERAVAGQCGASDGNCCTRSDRGAGWIQKKKGVVKLLGG
jgi:hypothetical protein